MSSVLFISDFHLGHRTILKHSANADGSPRGGTTAEEHNEWVINQCLAAGPTKRTLWWILGDVAMEEGLLPLLGRLPGIKKLIAGNHDTLPSVAYLRYFQEICGVQKKYGIWLSHAPLHPVACRGLPNIHGHCHHNETRGDPAYLNVSIEWAPNKMPISLDQVRAHFRALNFTI
jgi:calcineurin-like phosphoesterase family protein